MTNTTSDKIAKKPNKRLRTSRVSINAIENGVYVPSTVLALKIAKTLNCTVEDVFQLPKV